MGSRSRVNPSSRGSTNTKNKKRLTQEEEDSLINKYGILFDRSRLPSRWLAAYTPIFHKIREIEGVRYEEYRASLGTCAHRIQRVRTLNRVHRLVRDVSDCRKSSLHEEEWRRSTEPYLLQHFDNEATCQSCGNRAWVAEFRIDPPSAPVATSGHHATIPLCVCNPNEIVQNEAFARLDRPFLSRVSMPIEDASSPVEIGVRKPDVVVGLRKTPQARELLDKLSGITYSLAKNQEMLFPFLVLEAKSEVGGHGFRSIETQTAFPIRTLVNIQKSLNQHSAVTRQPLVWFLAYQGEMWRVYGCFPDGRLTKAVLLWDGAVENYDHALQLYLIVDFIYEWAIGVYQQEIFTSLSGGTSVDIWGCGPPETPISNAMDGLTGLDPPIDLTRDDPSPNTQDFEALSLSRSSSDMHMQDLELDVAMGNQSSLSPVTVPEVQADDWSTCAVIRHTDEAFLTFHHLELPETRMELTAILSSIQPNRSLLNAAAKVLLHLLNVEDPIMVNRALIGRLENIWTGEATHTESSEDGPVIAHISFRSYFRPSDWKVIRALSCITASIPAINALGSIAYDGYDSLLGVSMLSISHLTADIAFPLRRLSGQESAAAALQNLSLTLQKERGGHGCTWLSTKENGRHVKEIWSGLDTHTPSIPLFTIMVYSSCLTTIRPAELPNTQSSLGYAKLGWMARVDGAFILKRPSTWTSQCPKYCLAIFDTSDVTDGTRMGSKIFQAIAHGNFYQESGHGVQDDDRRAVEDWANFLLGSSR